MAQPIFIPPELHPNLLQIAQTAPSDWIVTAIVDWSTADSFCEHCYSHGLFTLPNLTPDKRLTLLANPQQRYCLDLTQAKEQQIKWTRGNKMRRTRRSNFRLTMDRDFKGSLMRLRTYHNSNSDAKETAASAESEAPAESEAAPAEAETETEREKGWLHDGLLNLLSRGHQSATGTTVQHHVFELWDTETNELLAITAGFGIGSTYHDYSHATLISDKRSAGQVLTKTVAHLLQQCGYGLWYWGFKVGYMQEYDSFGGRNVGRKEFYDRWMRLSKIAPLYDLQKVVARSYQKDEIDFTTLIAPLEITKEKDEEDEQKSNT